MISSGEYDPENPVIVPRKEDKIYRYPQIQTKPRSQAAIIYIMDVSGSMGDMQKEIVRTASFWIDGWLNKNYSNLETKYIIHSTTAEEVTKHRFYHTHESGGTQISSSYELASKILKSNYPFSDWNVYVFQFSDGDNWSHDDSNSINILKTDFLGKISQFAYGQVESPFGSGRYLNLFNEHFEKEERFVSSTMETKEDVYSTLKDFLGKGH